MAGQCWEGPDTPSCAMQVLDNRRTCQVRDSVTLYTHVV